MIRRPPRSTLSSSSAASDVYKRQEVYCRASSKQVTKLSPLGWTAVSVKSRDRVRIACAVVNRASKVACCYVIDFDKTTPVSYTHLRAHETPEHLVCRLLLEKKKKYICTEN
eukprot:TRINITY_DN19993_c0_g1_i1.p1 TRINITY_DN19993_c0_g1~~TRINITY_DN19993_c0_g1_i1.p1  ORF type:complete len:112 (-),score=12.92 TRINITY_DN19993_c0_g1_i1:64-399(-)